MEEDNDDSENEELTVTNFTELKYYIRNNIVKKNYESFKNYLKLKKRNLTRCQTHIDAGNTKLTFPSQLNVTLAYFF
jgi:hypothetical protein